MYKIGELSRLTGVSIRALRHYDAIGLMPPAAVTEAGYRLYDEDALLRVEHILFFRELDFPLERIRLMLAQPDAENEILQKQRTLLSLKRDRLTRLLALLDDRLKGETEMHFDTFDRKEMDETKKQYEQEARTRWGNTKEYRQSTARDSVRTDSEQAELHQAECEIFAAFAKACADGIACDSPEAAALTRRWQAHITRQYYDCTDEILKGLGQMYAADGRFKEYLDGYGAGTAQYMADAIAAL